MRKYLVRGILKRDNKAKRFSTTVSANFAFQANRSVKEVISIYCENRYPDEVPLQCIINKKTIRM